MNKIFDMLLKFLKLKISYKDLCKLLHIDKKDKIEVKQITKNYVKIERNHHLL